MACYITIYILAKQMTSIHLIWLLTLTEWLHDNGCKSERYREMFAPSNGRISEPFQSLTAARPCDSFYYKLSNHIATGYKCRYPILVKYNQQLYKITTHCHNTCYQELMSGEAAKERVTTAYTWVPSKSKSLAS